MMTLPLDRSGGPHYSRDTNPAMTANVPTEIRISSPPLSTTNSGAVGVSTAAPRYEDGGAACDLE
jgi:hypothetical protein